VLIATAGHVDHGKTALVRRLTGVETDRLPEERQRGLTIDLGFAYRVTPGGASLGFVDVPGHARFVPNMLAGVPAIDFALLVVAADAGPAAQTREHLAILDLLGIARGAVVLTRSDLVDAARLAACDTEVRELLDGSVLAKAPRFPVSSLTGAGIDALLGHLETAAEALPQRTGNGRFRLAVDRAFTLAGIGLVVTGAAFAGRVAVGDTLQLEPAGRSVRVRGLHANDRAAASGAAGQRLALNLAGGGHGKLAVARGEWLCGPPGGVITTRCDAWLRLLDDAPRALRHWAPVHLHVGATELPARLVPLAGHAVDPGAAGVVQLVLEQPTSLVYGLKFVIRDPAAQQTLGGGMLLDPHAPRRGRATADRLARLARLRDPDPASVFAALLDSDALGVASAPFAAARNLRDDELAALLAAVPHARLTTADGEIAHAPGRLAAWERQVTDTLRDWHAARPEEVGPQPVALWKALTDGPARAQRDALLARMVHAGTLRREGARLRLPGHVPAWPDDDRARWETLADRFGSGELCPPATGDLAKELDGDLADLDAFLQRVARRGALVRVTANRYLHPDALAALAGCAEALAEAADDGLFDARAFRDRAGIGRNFTIALLEYFDALGLTRRIGNRRLIRQPAGQLLGRVNSPA
jgi:selenocysteine-specific elongation factor